MLPFAEFELQFAAYKYVLTDQVFVTSGTTLTIQPGTTIFTSPASLSGVTSALIVAKGGRISAPGTFPFTAFKPTVSSNSPVSRNSTSADTVLETTHQDPSAFTLAVSLLGTVWAPELGAFTAAGVQASAAMLAGLRAVLDRELSGWSATVAPSFVVHDLLVLTPTLLNISVRQAADGYELRGSWLSPQALRVEVVDAGSLDSNLTHQNRAEPPNFRSGAWFVTTSFSASQAPMLVCGYGGVTVPACAYGEPSPPSVPRTTDQFGNSGLDNYGRMLGPRYPHSWSRVTTRQCEDYLTFFNNYATTPPVIRRWPITGSVGPVGTPTIIEFSASDPNDINLAYGAGDELRITFDMATDRSNSTMLGRYSGDREYVDSLFAFNAQLGQSYSGEWLDDSIFQIAILEPSYRSLPPFLADGHVHPNNTCTVRARETLQMDGL